eukprot:CAMPEP_0174251170 /NCGR_PEP_ID=MMETSP0439-20130205/1077_1 /TAXON_ID=0 /ORGANISM="Stereomyxa ramosa, Strain Chinc5" /LENGTH=575 /DNA_ID=CAMNT_0015331413 /DNA_START=32 /DNA_END=1756 /DNA_ORIENTATION=+
MDPFVVGVIVVVGLVLSLLILKAASPKKTVPTIDWSTSPQPITDADELESALERVASNKEKWHSLSHEKKLKYLYQIRDNLEAVANHWGQLEAKVRKYEGPVNKAMGPLFGPAILGLHLNTLIASYEYLVKNNSFMPAVSERDFEDQKIVTVFPRTGMDKVFQAGVKGELWLAPGKKTTQGKFLKEKPSFVAILGAGNFEAPTDILGKMFVHNKVAIYKSHPMNRAAVDPILPVLFKPLIDDGYLAICSGEVGVGQAILHSELTDEAMMTGGCATFDRIVWGSPEEQEKRKESGAPVFEKPFTAELGAVSPWIIVPGDWSKGELQHQAEFLAASKMANASAICASPQIVVLDKDWPLAQEFVKKVEEVLKNWPDFEHYYVGTLDRVSSLEKSSPNSYHVKNCSDDKIVDPLIIPETDDDSLVLKSEAFAPVLAYHYLETGNDVEKFLKEAVNFCNNCLFGTLSGSIMISPKTQKKHSDAFEKALKDLAYGSIGVNEWGGSVNFFGHLRWGARPGAHTKEDIQSGEGQVGNYCMYDHIEKTVLRSPFVSPGHLSPPKPRMAKVYPRMTNFAIKPTW